MSKSTDERSTPQELFDKLHKRFNFETDLAATDQNAKLPKYYTAKNSAFKYEWTGRNFCNPPFSELYRWLKYGSKQKALIVYIVPCDSSTQWFHDFLWDEELEKPRPGIKFILPKGRHKWGNNSNSAKFATVIIVMDNRNELAKSIS